MGIKNNRMASFLAVTIIYIIAIGAGTITYMLLPYACWSKLIIADIIATVVTFVFSLLIGNASVYDPYWSVQPLVILGALAVRIPMNPARVLMLSVIGVWGVRLTANWAYTFQGLAYQDWRYTLLQEKTGRWYPVINFVGIHLVPTLIVYLCLLPAVQVMLVSTIVNMESIVCMCLSLGAVILQGTADIQMHKFRRTKANGFIHTGVWKNSRHPNYLGEILMWWGIGLAAVAMMPDRWYLLLGAALNTCLFLFVSIPLADQHQARKESFSEYKNTTRMLLPIPR